MIDSVAVIRHFVASLAYRFQSSVRGAGSEFGGFEPGSDTRTPAEIVRHMTHVITFARHLVDASIEVAAPFELPFDQEIARFHESLAGFDRRLEGLDAAEDPQLLLRILQGPLSDCMTHVGQLAMLRRLAGVPIAGQRFFEADIRIGRVGPDQGRP